MLCEWEGHNHSRLSIILTLANRQCPSGPVCIREPRGSCLVSEFARLSFRSVKSYNNKWAGFVQINTLGVSKKLF